MTAAVILREAAELLSKPDAWIQQAYSRTADGKWCPPTDPDAVCWCVRGAIAKVVGSWLDSAVKPAEDALRSHLGRDGLAQWNDERGRSAPEVVGALVAAADGLEAKS